MNPNYAPQMGQPMPQPGATPWGNAAAPSPSQGFNQFGGGGMAPARATQLPAGDGAPISFNPSTFTEGGMIDNCWVRFTNGRATTFDYKGKSSSGPAPAVIYDLQIVDANTHQPLPGAALAEKVWTVGKLDDFVPRANGVQFWSPTGKTGFNRASNWAVFIRAAVLAGIPADVFNSGQVDALNNMVAFVRNVKTGGREGMRNTTGTGGTAREDSGTLVVTQIPGGARIEDAALVAVVGGGAVAQPLTQPLTQAAPQAMAPAPQQIAQVAQVVQPAQAPAQAQPVYAPPAQTPYVMPPQQMAQPMAQPMAPMMAPPAQAQAQAPQAPAAPTVDVAAAQRLLAEVLQTNPTSKQAFNVALFQRAMTDEPLRNLVSSPEFQRQMLGTPLNLA